MKHVLITGGSSGIGEEIARLLATSAAASWEMPTIPPPERVDAWRSRLVERSSEQLAIEVVFGSEWRDVRWAKRQRTWDGRSACAVY